MEVMCKDMPNVEKRDGSVVPFSLEKLTEAIFKAFKSTEVEEKVSITQSNKIVMKAIPELYRKQGVLHVKDIHETVETLLMKSEYPKVARSYIEFRNARDIEWEQLTSVDSYVEKLANKDKSVVNENANKDSRTFTTQRDLTAGAVAKAKGLEMYPKRVAKAHLKGEIHLHDLDYSPYTAMTNCHLADFKSILDKGTTIGNAQVEKPKSIQTAVAIVSQASASIASQQFGGVSFNRADEVLAEYAEMNYQKHYYQLMGFAFPSGTEPITSVEHIVKEAERLTIKDIYDSMQSLEYEVNTLFSSNGQ